MSLEIPLGSYLDISQGVYLFTFFLRVPLCIPEGVPSDYSPENDQEILPRNYLEIFQENLVAYRPAEFNGGF